MPRSVPVAQVFLTILPETTCIPCSERIHWVGFNNLDLAWTSRGAAPTMQSSSLKPPQHKDPHTKWCQSEPPPEAEQHLPGKATKAAPHEQHNLFLNLGSALPRRDSGLTPEFPRELWLVAQHGQASDALLCKNSAGRACPAPHYSPHITGHPSGSRALLRLGQLGDCCHNVLGRDCGSSLEPEPRPTVSWETVQ